MSTFNQSEFDIRCEWGRHGIEQLASISDAVIIVDVLSFSTCVDIAVGRGALVYPFPFKDCRLIDYARRHKAIAASPERSEHGLSLSPVSLMQIECGAHIVLPSPNGSQLSLSVPNALVLAGCLRNADAVAAWVTSHCATVAVIAAGERWPDGSFRPAAEDLIGAGAIIARLSGSRSPEARVAVAAFENAVRYGLDATITGCSSGKELIARRFAGDVHLAAEWNASTSVPTLRDDAYCSQAFES